MIHTNKIAWRAISARVLDRAKSLLTSWLTYAVIILVACIFFLYNKQERAQKGDRVSPQRKTVVQLIEVSGRVSPSEEATLSFEKSAVVTNRYIEVGDEVKAGQVLATLDGSKAETDLKSAQASVEKSMADVALLTNGVRPEELALKEQAKQSAKNNVATQYGSVRDVLVNVDSVVRDALYTKLSGLFLYSPGKFSFTLQSCDQNLTSKIEKRRADLEGRLKSYEGKLDVVFENAREEYDSLLLEAKGLLGDVVALSSDTVTLLSFSCVSNDTQAITYRTTLATLRASLDSALALVSAKQLSIVSALNALSQAEKDVLLAKAGSNPEQVKSATALLSQSLANKEFVRNELDKYVLRSPFDAKVAHVSFRRGETSKIGEDAVRLISKSGFKVAVQVREADIGKIKPGNDVTITLDAYGEGVVFAARVTRIDPSPVFSGGVPLYTVTAHFNEADPRILDGMTAHAKITTLIREQALTLPPLYIERIDKDRGLVRLVNGENVIDQEVTLGIRNVDGSVEILSGITDQSIIEEQTIVERGSQKNTK